MLGGPYQFNWYSNQKLQLYTNRKRMKKNKIKFILNYIRETIIPMGFQFLLQVMILNARWEYKIEKRRKQKVQQYQTCFKRFRQNITLK